jgi:hypothetical protein
MTSGCMPTLLRTLIPCLFVYFLRTKFKRLMRYGEVGNILMFLVCFVSDTILTDFD